MIQLRQSVFLASLLILYGCNLSVKQEKLSNSDSTLITDSTLTSMVMGAPNVEGEKKGLTVKVQHEMDEDSTEIVFEIANQWSFISNPYDFELDTETVLNLLGEEARLKQENYEAGDDDYFGQYDAYSYYTIEGPGAEISFYSYPGKHYSTITTPVLPLKNNVRIGMSKINFINAMSIISEDRLSTVTKFTLHDDYGYMFFLFRADSLNKIHIYYEEGD